MTNDKLLKLKSFLKFLFNENMIKKFYDLQTKELTKEEKEREYLREKVALAIEFGCDAVEYRRSEYE